MQDITERLGTERLTQLNLNGVWSLVLHDLHLRSTEDAKLVVAHIVSLIAIRKQEGISIQNIVIGGDVVQAFGNNDAHSLFNYFFQQLRPKVDESIIIHCVLGNHEWAALSGISDRKRLTEAHFDPEILRDRLRVVNTLGIQTCVDTIVTHGNVTLIPDASSIIGYPRLFVFEEQTYKDAISGAQQCRMQEMGSLLVGHNPDMFQLLPENTRSSERAVIFGHTHGLRKFVRGLGRLPFVASRLMSVGHGIVPEWPAEYLVSGGSNNQRVPLFYGPAEYYLVQH